MDTDILVYAVIALLLLARLWQVLGRKSDDDRERQNPFADPQPSAPRLVASKPSGGGDVPVLAPIFTVAPTSLAGGLAQLASLDPQFNEKRFVADRRQDFTTIVNAFAKGEMAECEGLMQDNVKQHFNNAIGQRRQAGQSLENKIIRIVDAEVASVAIEGSVATVRVRLVSDQENILRDASGKVIGGAAGLIEEITDLWSFVRDMAVKDAPWRLAETRS